MSKVIKAHSRRAFLGFVAAAISLPLIGTNAQAEKMNLLDGVAIQGYDPVAYFTANAAIDGEPSISADYRGAKYYFSSAENRDAFLANPEKYAPQYGGFCAFAVSKGYVAPIDPAAFSIVDNKLYLNYSKRVQKTWSKDIPGHIKSGNSNWPGLSKN